MCRDTIYDGFDGLDFDSYVKTKLAFKVNPKTKIKKMIPLGVKRGKTALSKTGRKRK